MTDVQQHASYGPALGGVRTYSVGGNSVVYTAPIAGSERPNFWEVYPALEVTRLDELLTPYNATAIGLFASSRGHPPQLLEANFSSRFRLSTSPSGEWSVVAYSPKDLPTPDAWRLYTDSNESGERFVLWNLREGRSRPLLDAPLGTATTYRIGAPETLENPWPRLVQPAALWSRDSDRVILVNTALPLDDPARRVRDMAYIVEYEITSGKWNVLEPLVSNDGRVRVDQVSWLVPGRELLITHRTVPERPFTRLSLPGQPTEGSVYKLVKGQWVKRTVPAKIQPNPSSRNTSPNDVQLEGNISVNVRESANQAPTIVAHNGVHEIELTGSDPALDGVRLSRMEPITWVEPDGRSATGGLVLPQEFASSSPPPLVIQVYEYSPNLFRPDGPYPTAFAAQALASSGFAVLNVQMPSRDRPETSNSTRETRAMVERIDAIIGELSQRGLIDADRIGLVGFSRSAFLSYYAVTHPGRRAIQAAVSADGWIPTLGGQAADYARFGMRKGVSTLDEIEIFYGGSFASKTNVWLENDPSFSVHRVRTPMLFQYIGAHAVAYVPETLGMFRAARRPADFLLFPRGLHQLQRPREREVSMSATVDWMNFWLQGRLDPDPAKRLQYERWMGMRKQQEAVLTELSSRGESVATLQPLQQLLQSAPR